MGAAQGPHCIYDALPRRKLMTPQHETLEINEGVLESLLSGTNFCPTEPASIEETGLGDEVIERLVCKYLAVFGTTNGRTIADQVCLPFRALEPLLATLRTNQIVVYAGSAPFNDYYYSLTTEGRKRAMGFLDACSYVGPAPVPLTDYVISVEAQSITAESPGPERLAAAVRDISVDPNLFESLGPAVNSGAGMFLYGAPGNGKSTLAKRITLCFGDEIWIPHAIWEDGQVIKFYDSAYHKKVLNDDRGIIKCGEYDRRWLKISRPTVVVGGELTMDNLELRHDPRTNINEAPLQMKSNCGCLLIDDFGRQRIEPAQLLNRWIVPLEMRYDFLTLVTGKKLKVPFDQLVIFSTNLKPRDLVDEAFLRRIPFKIEIGDPSEEEFHQLFELYSRSFGCEYRHDVIEGLLDRHYRQTKRRLRRCQPRDLLLQIRSYCNYASTPLEMRPEYFDRAVKAYFATVLGQE
jgi:predicted ATPase with chaperone activity